MADLDEDMSIDFDDHDEFVNRQNSWSSIRG